MTSPATANPATLEYATQPPPNRYEFEMESERARWLRRRFLWFTGTLVVLALIMLPMALGNVASNSGYMVGMGVMQIGAALTQIVAAGWAWWYARRRVRNERRLFAIAFWLVVGLGVLGVFGSRIGSALGVEAEMQRYEQNLTNDLDFRAGPMNFRVEGSSFEVDTGDDALPTSKITDAPVAGRRRAPPFSRAGAQAVSLGSILWGVLTAHLVACLFLPWTVREATKPAVFLLGAAGLVVLFDLVTGNASPWYIFSAILLFPMTVIPGIGWCWWRYSRFQRRFRSSFESKQLRQLTYELTGARKIHEASLPPVFPTGPLRLSYIYEPMSQIGGDLLYVHPRPPDSPPDFSDPANMPPPARHTLVLLDVTGHGIAAALTVNRLIGELERVFAESPEISAGGLIQSLNRYVFLTLATHGVFVTGVAISVDATEHPDCATAFREPHKVTFASAGHPSTFLRRVDGRIELLESTSTMLGVLPPDQYQHEEQSFRLRPGEAIVAYTDGALEARNLDDDMIGIEGVRDVLRQIAQVTSDPYQWPEQIIRRVAAFRASPPADDTLIACIYRPPVPAEAPQRAQGHREHERVPQAALATAG